MGTRQTVDVMYGDDVYPGTSFQLGVQFGIEAAVATINLPKSSARDAVKELFDNLRADMRDRLKRAKRSKRLEAV